MRLLGSASKPTPVGPDAANKLSIQNVRTVSTEVYMRRALYYFVGSLGLASCASGPVRKEPFAGFDAAPPESALLYVFRPKAFTGGGVWYDIKLSEHTVSALENCSFAKISVAPGNYVLSTTAHPVISGEPDPIRISARANERYFYMLDISGSFASATGTPGLYGHTKIGWRSMQAAQAEMLLSGCNRVERAPT